MTVSARRSWIAPTLAATAASAIALAAPTFPLDDAYITLHNARALLAGGWDATYGTSALTGATSLIHLLLVAALGLLLPLPAASWLVTIAGTALYAAGLDRMAVQAGVGRVTVVVTGLFSGYMLFNLVNGLETGLALAAMTWALVLIDHRHLPVLLGALPFIRPEFTLLSLPLLAHCCWRDRADLGRVAEHLAWFGAAALPWLLVTWTMTGSPVPATASAKVAFFGEEHEPLLRKVVDALWIIGVSAIGPLLAGLAGLRRARGGWAVAVFVVLWLSAITLTFPGGINQLFPLSDADRAGSAVRRDHPAGRCQWSSDLPHIIDLGDVLVAVGRACALHHAA